MTLTHQAATAIGHTLENVRAGERKLASRKLELAAPTLCVTSRSFEAGGVLPIANTADGAGTPPTIDWENAPASTQAFVVICEDPDAPFPQPYVHWLLYRILRTETSTGSVPLLHGVEGKNSGLKVGFTGAAPPPGHGVHHYHFQVFALDAMPDIDAGAGRGALLAQMHGHVLAWGEVVATYERT